MRLGGGLNLFGGEQVIGHAGTICNIAPLTSAILHDAARGALCNFARMDEEREKVRRYIAEVTERTGLSLSALALEAKVSSSTLTRFMNSEVGHVLSTATLAKIRKVEAERAAVGAPSRPAPSTVRDAPEVAIPGRASMPISLPVYGTAAGGNGDGAFILSTSDVVDRVRRPSSLAENKLAYGLYVEGDSMEPQIYAGELLIVDPAKKARPRDKVVLVISYPDGEGIRSMAYVKELVRIGADKVTVRQFNPPKEIEFPKANVASLHRILTTAELFGV